MTLRQALEASIAKNRPKFIIRKKQPFLIHLIELLNAGERKKAITMVRLRGTSLAEAAATISHLEWMMRQRP